LRVILAEDSVLVRAGLATLLGEAGFDVVGQACDATELLPMVATLAPDVVIVDLRLPPTRTDEGLRAALDIRANHPSVAILVLSQYREAAYATELFANGTQGLGYLLKDQISDPDDFTNAVRRVGTGGTAIDPEIVTGLLDRRRSASPLHDLTDRQRAVLSLMAQGRTNQAICDHLSLTPKTVEAHIRTIFAKLDLTPSADSHRRVLAVLAYLRS
jgi:DNA-binding NarL/FixJ family response regulator